MLSIRFILSWVMVVSVFNLSTHGQISKFEVRLVYTAQDSQCYTEKPCFKPPTPKNHFKSEMTVSFLVSRAPGMGLVSVLLKYLQTQTCKPLTP